MVDLHVKTCKDCGVEKSVSEFYEVYVEGRKYYRQACKECWRGRTDRARKTPQGKIAVAKRNLRNYYKTRFGLTEEEYKEEYNSRYDAQAGLCAVCKRPKELVLDHCHVTAALRELLCSTCNSGIGLLFDDPVILEAAAVYVRKHGSSGRTWADGNPESFMKSSKYRTDKVRSKEGRVVATANRPPLQGRVARD